jgi:PII-like signaling protein
MSESQRNISLRIFTGELSLGDQRPLYQGVVEKVRAAQLAGAAVITNPLGFGRRRFD